MAENNVENPQNDEKKAGLNFVQQLVADDLKAGKNGGRLNTRFPPEPNGYLHIGHAKAICMDFGVAEMFGGTTNLRFDDTNPVKEDTEYEQAIMRDIHWLGYDWGDRLYYASDYFPKLFDFAIDLIKRGLAYVDDQSAEQIAAQKGTPTTPGQNSPYRDRTPEENLDLFLRMNKGEFPEGSRVLRAKIDMASDNMHFRDPIMYRIILKPHWRTGDKWKVYPMYDFAHGQSDYFEGVTHSICTLEFVPHRPLYDYFVRLLAGDTVDQYCPRQIEFNRLNLTYTVMSKRKLRQLVEEHTVSGWDDPRMPTLCGLRRRGYTPQSIKNFINDIGYTKYEALNDISLLEHAIRDDLNRNATRVCAVLNPVKVVITNYPDDKVELLDMDNNPEQENAGTHKMPFSRELYIERDDFMENPPKKFFRLTPGKEVRLKGGYIIMCTGCTKDAQGNVTEIQCTYDPDTLSGMPGANRKVKGTLHWVSARHCHDAEVRLYDRLFAVENPGAETERDFRELLNPDSLKVIDNAKIEPWLADNAKVEDKFQFQRIGYFCVDPDSTPEKLVFNRTIGLKDSWAKAQKK
ncbi:MAG: glutamine--tRNA ligase/YqeY domain fusion protein [Sodaliphilus pleomorphus]|jgi:glutaminyl-tRNA synthetase|uniref:glutamine--tRNA ligase/YqeY domain fusion protein n=1 Tax=Sodaliphilus pleomorphus TaxID=2606626 RepID=UPI0023F3A07D|nr:glutamine--tRNA ligase/YqeY domain fusion protein [Sodaliphilus pleomorphus]MDD7066939.1 glutamine--tRNA ligase/YqeY domain fusion protein [Sodaliphilus pleomorphus]MDY2832158.1 glutamine--tRNA ligase/YqeY domain fusion protein [Sodaliphilus pleomorphus]MDY6251335.1 glutamine--tRNA ligase/YqeY domain fusion protein [Bacteroidales bacterium]